MSTADHTPQHKLDSGPQHALNKRALTWPMMLAACGGTLAWYVPKDVMAPSALRGAIRVAGVAGGLGWVVVDSATTTVEQIQEDTSSDKLRSLKELPKWQIALALVVIATVVVASVGLAVLVERKIVQNLESRGIKYPNTVWGAVSAVVIAVSLWMDPDYDPELPGGITSRF